MLKEVSSNQLAIKQKAKDKVTNIPNQLFCVLLEKYGGFLLVVSIKIWPTSHTLSTSSVPNNPSGLKIKITNIIRYGATTEKPFPNEKPMRLSKLS